MYTGQGAPTRLECVTSHVTETLIKLIKLPLSLKARANQVTEVGIQIQRQRLKVSRFCLVWTDGLSQQILKIY
jgi:hypothetical protein